MHSGGVLHAQPLKDLSKTAPDTCALNQERRNTQKALEKHNDRKYKLRWRSERATTLRNSALRYLILQPEKSKVLGRKMPNRHVLTSYAYTKTNNTIKWLPFAKELSRHEPRNSRVLKGCRALYLGVHSAGQQTAHRSYPTPENCPAHATQKKKRGGRSIRPARISLSLSVSVSSPLPSLSPALSASLEKNRGGQGGSTLVNLLSLCLSVEPPYATGDATASTEAYSAKATWLPNPAAKRIAYLAG